MAEHDSGFDGVIVGYTHVPAADLIPALYEWNRGLPIITLGQPVAAEQLPEDCRNTLLGHLNWPVSYNRMVDVLHRCQMYREQYEWGRSRQQHRDTKLFRSLVGSSREVQHVREMMAQVADKDVTVLILGESGTGKEVVARNLHYHSERKDEPFVPVNCGAIPGELLESELFGHEKGAFTGAIQSMPGKFGQANGGTILLDEISEMDLGLQAKLLRVLQEREVERIGGRKVIDLDVLVLATTNRDLQQSVRDGQFQEDLYYRLSVFPLEWKPLRERVEDIIPLAERLMGMHAEKMQKQPVQLDESARMALLRHTWPGNIREMDNAIQRALILQQGSVITEFDLGLAGEHLIDQDQRVHQTEGAPADNVLTAGVKQHEYQLILDALRAAQGRKKQAAENLGISPRALRYKMARLREMGVDVDAAMA